MKRTLKLFALLLALVMVMALLPTTALAEGQSPESIDTETPAPNGYIRSPEHGTRAVSDAYARGDMETYYRLKGAEQTRDTLPSSYDGRNYNYVTSVKNQNPYGSCWAHAAVASIESYMIKHGVEVGSTGAAATTSLNLSETQHCFFNYSSAYDAEGMLTGDKCTLLGGDSCLDSGGNGEMSAYTLQRWCGAASESVSALAYGRASTVASSGLDSQYSHNYNISHVQNSEWIPATDIEGVKRAIMSYGAGNISYYAGSGNYTYNCTIDTTSQESSSHKWANHAITIIGWDDSIAASKFSPNRPSGNGAWLCKNSWGTSYFDKGYMYISYEDTSVLEGYIFFYDAEPIDNYDHNYQYDGSCNVVCYGKGWNNSINYYEGFANNTKVANVFTAKGSEMLKAVALCNWDEALSYTVEIYKNPTAGNPSSGTLMSTQSGTLTYSGYYTIVLDTPVLLSTGDTFSVVFTQNCPTADDEGKYIHTPYDATFNNSDVVSWASWTHANHGNTSYYQEPNGAWIDCPDNGDYRIKAYTVDYENPYTVTAVSNNDSYGTVSVTGTVITATPAAGYYVESAEVISGTAVVSVNGNTVNVSPESDCTVRVNFAPKPSYTVNFVASGNAEGNQTAYLGDAITLPTSVSINPDGWTFSGWVTAQLEETAEEPAFFAPGADYTVTGNVTLYALFTRVDGEGGDETVYELVTSTPSDWAGNYVITNNSTNLNTSGLYVLKGVAGSSGGTDAENASNCTTFASSGITLTDNVLHNVADTYVITLAAQGSYYTVRSASVGSYYGMNSSSYLYAYSGYKSSYCRWTPAINTNGVVQLKNAANGSYPYFSWSTSNSYFWSGSSTNANVLRLWKENQITNSVTYYATDPVVAVSHAVTITSGSATFEYDGTLKTNYQYTVTVDGEPVEADAAGLTFTLPTGDVLTITPADTAVVTHVREGAVENAFTYSFDSNEDQYQVTATYGTLSVTPHAVTLTVVGNHDTVVYNGKSQNVKGWTLECDDELFWSAREASIIEHLDPPIGEKAWMAVGTEPGTYYMNIDVSGAYLQQVDTGETAAHFVDDFAPVWEVVDGYLVIVSGPAFKTQSLVLEGQIGVNFFLDLPQADAYEYEGVDFTIDNLDGADASVPFSTDLPTNGSGYYQFTYYVRSIEMADTITATLRYRQNGEDKTLEKTYSVKQYFETYDDYKELFTPEQQAMTEATADYGHYVQAFLDTQKNWAVGTDYAEMDKHYADYTEADITAAQTGLADYVTVKSTGTNVEKISYTLLLDSDTELRVYFKPAKNFTGTFTFTVNGETITEDGGKISVSLQSDGRYMVSVRNIAAHELGDIYEIKALSDGDEASITVSALSYVQAIMTSYAGNAAAVNAATAIWRYATAAKALIP